MTATIRIGENCTLTCGESVLLKARSLECLGQFYVYGEFQSVVIHSTGVIGGTGTVYHSFMRTGEESRSTIMPSVTQINIDRDYDGALYHRAFENAMIQTFDLSGPLAAFAMGVPFILQEPRIKQQP